MHWKRSREREIPVHWKRSSERDTSALEEEKRVVLEGDEDRILLCVLTKIPDDPIGAYSWGRVLGIEIGHNMVHFIIIEKMLHSSIRSKTLILYLYNPP